MQDSLTELLDEADSEALLLDADSLTELFVDADSDVLFRCRFTY